MPYTTGQILKERYRIEKRIGSGAFGEVYLATHLELHAPRALKVLRKDAPGLGSSEFQNITERFRLEAALGAKLDHPNLVRVYDFEHDEQTLILVMEYCPGGSLADRLNKARDEGELLPVDVVVQIGLDVARGLAELHKLDVVHRDIKPSNILFDQQGRPKLADYGLAQTPGGLSMRSLMGSLAQPHPGTPGYMSPEQHDDRNYLSPPSDVYALGLVLFEALSGRAYRNLRPGTRLKGLRPDTPEWLDELVMSMLAEDTKARPWDASEVIELLQQGREQEQRLRREIEEQAQREAQEEQRQREAAQDRLQAEERQRAEAQEKGRFEVEERRRREAAEQARLEEQRRKRQQAEEKAGQKGPAKPGLGVLAGIAAVLVLVGIGVIVGIFLLLNGSASSSERTATARSLEMTQTSLAALLVTEGPVPTPRIITVTQPDPEITATKPPSVEPTEEPIATSGSEPPANARLGDTWTSPVDGMVLAYIPAGEFQMGSETGDDDEKPIHTVSLDAFWMDLTEVTNAMFEQFANASGYQTTAEKEGSAWVFDLQSKEWKDTSGADWRHPQGPKSGINSLKDHPVVQVSWQDAAAYCEWAGRRLPTEAEWEKAARGTDGRTYPWGEDAPNGELANFADRSLEVNWADKNVDDGYQFTAPVGSYPKGVSPYGIFDLAGNVWEWVADWYSETYYQSAPRNNPAGPASGEYRVLRGGSWSLEARNLRAANRIRNNPNHRLNYIGFRCAR